MARTGSNSRQRTLRQERLIGLCNWYSTELGIIQSAHEAGYMDDGEMLERIEDLQNKAVMKFEDWS